MPRSSKASLSDETLLELENQFYEFISSLTPEERRKFFSEFLTNEEKMMMFKRLALYWCLLEGYTLSKIQQMIGVTHDTTRVYNKKKDMLSDEFKALLKRIGSQDVIQPKEELDTNKPAEAVQLAPEEQPSFESENITKENEESMEEKRDTEEFQMPSIEHHEEEVMINLNENEKPNIEQRMDEIIEEMNSQSEERNDTNMKESESEISSGLTPSESVKNEEDNNEDEGKKKSGLAKFFGF